MITNQRTEQTASDDTPQTSTSHRLVDDLGVRVGPLTRRYEIQHPGVIDHAMQARSIAAQVGRHRKPRRPAQVAAFAGDDTSTVRMPRIVLTASAPL